MPQIGQRAPDFSLISDSGQKVSLKDFRNKSVILYFYPKDDTPGCTKEACGFRDNQKQFSQKEAVVLGVSMDDQKSHQKFKEKYQLPFTLLADEKGSVSKAYEVYKKKSMYGRTYWGIERTTFLIGPDGKIRQIFAKVKVDGHIQEVLASLS